MDHGFAQSGFMPHGHCYLWQPALVWTHVISDFLIGAAYLTISLSLYFIVRQTKIQFSVVVVSFGIFIGACGATHFMSIWNLWHANYWAAAWVKILTAAASVATSVYLIRLKPQILKVAEAAKLSEQRRLDLEVLTKDLEQRVAERSREAEENRQIAEAEKNRIKVITDSLPVLISSFDREGRYLMANRTYREWFNIDSNEDLIGMKVSDFVGEKAFANARPRIEKAFNGEATEFEAEMNYLNGPTRYIHASYIPVIGKTGTVDSVIALVSDITDRKRDQQELENQKSRAEAASRVKSQFLANMSHEIRTPLGAMLGFAQLTLESDPLTPEQKANLETVVRNGEQLYRIVNEVLDLSKVESDKIQIEKVPFNIKMLIQDVISLMSKQADAKNISVETNIDPAIPATIFSDSTRVRQILLNILGNAIKFTEKGLIKVTAQTKGKLLEISVDDTGSGIAIEQQADLFQPFNQADNTLTRKHGGTGLGLYLSRRLARALGGDLTLERCEIGRGCTFVFTISTEESKVSVEPVKVNIQKVDPHLLRDVRVLVVDDAPDNLVLTKRYLTSAGAAVETLNGATKLEELLSKEQFDVIVMDIQMPERDGYQAVELLRKQGYEKPVVALTAHAMLGEREKCLAAGFDDYLVKPINKALLIETVKAHAQGPAQSN